MKILSLHCDYINFKPLKKALKSIPSLSEEQKEGKEIKEPLVVMVAVEKGDKNITKVSKELEKSIKKLSEQLNVKKVVLYPYAHLSSNLGNPDVASGVLDETKKLLEKSGFEVYNAPFGYYKEFELKVKGHPLSELSKEIKTEESDSDASENKENYDPKQLLREISKSKLDTSKLKSNDHRIIGHEMDLFSFNDVAPGMVFWHNNGLIIYNELLKYWREKHRQENYEEIKTPQIMDSKLWKVSGHWDKYKENNFKTDYEKRDFLVKPMNCPGGMLVYKSSPRSYKDFPLRIGEIGVVHRCELSGVLAGLFRVIQFTQDDAHLFCTDEKQTKKEISGIIRMVKQFYEKFNLKFSHIELSTRPEKRIGSEKQWDDSERILEEVLKEEKVNYKINEGDGAFYGPKIDFHLKDSLNRTWQCSTIQLDFALPERFSLEYTDKDNSRNRPIVIHRVIYGAIERFIGILLESTNGRLPTWLSPVQISVLSFTDRNIKYAEKVVNQIKEKIPEVRINSDFRTTTIPSKVKDAEKLRVPYVIVVGDKEEKEGTLAIRFRGNKKISSQKIDDFISHLDEEIKLRK